MIDKNSKDYLAGMAAAYRDAAERAMEIAAEDADGCSMTTQVIISGVGEDIADSLTETAENIETKL